ncbi:hypothetical protein [Tuwongella immobilis]|uniref:Uncharacterized protein n=1 Tax=Tuwongella immobilis TaxID=692036 RepID=A0A6C2YMD8_9BACT|nr:hypothetical protein [Tuwongella immobilis]VIP02481.1 unnamed protein product [Tuwongella immobilis]VTS01529.1 unnamed protein product [Tuwongella immobilis]
MDDRPIYPTASQGPNGTPTNSTEQLEQRIRRLEDALASLQDTTHLEDRVVDRIIHTIESQPVRVSPNTGVIIQDPPALGPGRGRDSEPPTITVDPRQLLPYSPQLAQAAAAVNVASRASWLILDLVRDFTAIVKMYFDSRYRVTHTTQFSAMLLVAVLILSSLFTPFEIVDKVFSILISMVLFRILYRESLRYRELIGSLNQ